ncbi:MAG: hypothetical protein D6760_04500 [Deltaproteobacteria bacterium]|nr:MAG: hypothetical protein D6760_04500 [Deltaproteobacteria bacterium]
MWTLLAEEARRAVADAGSGSDRPGRGLLLEPVGDAAMLEARVYLHPGRALVGVVPLARVREQFDLSLARPYDSLGKAELAADGRPGLMIDVDGAFADNAGRRYPHVTFFLPRSPA